MLVGKISFFRPMVESLAVTSSVIWKSQEEKVLINGWIRTTVASSVISEQDVMLRVRGKSSEKALKAVLMLDLTLKVNGWVCKAVTVI